MSPIKKCKTCIISITLLLSSLSFFILIPSTVIADEGSAQTLYFSQFNLTEYTETLQPTKMLTALPDSVNESYFPPILGNSEDFANWILFWFLFKSFDIEGLDEFDFLELFDPFKIEQIYTFEGEEDVRIAGEMKFDLFFATNLPIKLGFTDQVQIIVSLNQEELKNVSTKIDPRFFGGKIQKQTIRIDGFDFSLEGGDELLFTIKMLNGDKPIGSVIKNRDLDTIIETADIIADSLIEQDTFPTLKEFGTVIKEFINASNSGDVNITLDDIAELVNAMRASALVFGSSQYPSSVTLPSKISDEENIKEYYLVSEGKLTDEKPDSEQGERVSLKEPQRWTGPGPTRYKIIKGATASLYLDYRDLLRVLNLAKARVNATLIYDNTTISSTEIELDKTTILTPLLQNIEPSILTFDFEEMEIQNDKDFILEIGVPSDVKFGPLDLGIYRNVNLLYDSSTYSSFLSVKFEETDHIKMELDSDQDQDIITGGTAKYILNVTSDFNDTIFIEVATKDKSGDWAFNHPESVQVSTDNYSLVPIQIIHENEELSAYDRDYIEIGLNVAGTRGFASKQGLVRVKKEAVDFNISVDFPSKNEVKHGEKGKYTFVIENSNTGLLPDSYEIDAYSENDWKVELNYDESEIENVQVGEDFVVEAIIFVPSYTEVSSDRLTLEITSIESGNYIEEKTFEIHVKTKVILPNALEHFYHAFENAAKSVGLDDVLGDSAAAFLIFIVFFLIFIFLFIFFILLFRKYVEIICLDRVLEIDPESAGVFDLKIFNPTKERLTYEIFAEKLTNSEGWDVSIEPGTISVDSKQSQFVKLTVLPTDNVKSNDWIEVKITAKPIDKKKPSGISVVTSVTPEKPKLDISGVYHWPRIFKKDSIVKTSFRVRNNGKVSANNVKIILNINGKEKNKVEDINIPRGGYAEIEIPWIAVKGKNHLDIVIN